jgi:hypothetical protein
LWSEQRIDKLNIPSFLLGDPKVLNNIRVSKRRFLDNQIIINTLPLRKPWETPNGATAIDYLVKRG